MDGRLPSVFVSKPRGVLGALAAMVEPFNMAGSCRKGVGVRDGGKHLVSNDQIMGMLWVEL